MNSPHDLKLTPGSRFPRYRWALCLSALLFFALVPACSSNPELDTSPRPPRSEGRWTNAFLTPSLLIAEDIRIEGPPALRSRLGLPQGGKNLNSITKATDNGLLHIFTLGGDEGDTIQAHLDRWHIVATKRLQVLERPFEADVQIVARGEAAWVPNSEDDEQPERRGAELKFTGELRQ